jgi:hypothetical protein
LLAAAQEETKRAGQEKMEVFRQKLAAETMEAKARQLQQEAEAKLAAKDKEIAERKEEMEETLAFEVIGHMDQRRRRRRR